jgi:hypothetical protein
MSIVAVSAALYLTASVLLLEGLRFADLPFAGLLAELVNAPA